MLKFILKLVVLMAAVALGRIAYEKVIDLPGFALEKIDLKGNSDMPQDSVLTLSGLAPGRSIYRQNLKYALSKITRIPSVVRCSIDRGIFTGIDIEIELAEPALLIKGKRLHCISREGVVLPFDESLPVLPLISGRKFSNIRDYEVVKDPDIVYGLRLYEELMKVSPDLCARLSEMSFASDSKILVYFSPEGTIAVVGKRDFDDAVERLAVLQKNGFLEGRRIIDLRFGPVAVESSLDKGIL